MCVRRLMMSCFLIAGLIPHACQGGPIIWAGFNGDWSTDPYWVHDAASNLTADLAFARRNGLEVESGERDPNVIIYSGQVIYDPNTNGDFRFRNKPGVDAGSLSLFEGASLTMSTDDGTVDGYWTQWDGRELNIDNSVFRRTANHANGSTGGAFMLGSWRSFTDQIIDVNIVNEGRLENDGQVWFGTPGESAVGLQVNVTINNGHLDLTGGTSYTLDNDGVLMLTADLAFIYGYNFDESSPKGESYALNFTGPGSVTVDQGGIVVATEEAYQIYTPDSTVRRSYQDLWQMGILQAKGESGATGAQFADFFTVAGSPGQQNYRLTSKVIGGDFNFDGEYNCADIDALVAAIVEDSNPIAFDLNLDSEVNLADRDLWLAEAGRLVLGEGHAFLLGDADLNGTVDENDLAVWVANEFSDAPGWCAGDFNADGIVDGSDFALWNSNKGRSSALAAAVPEPHCMAQVLLFGMFLSSLLLRTEKSR